MHTLRDVELDAAADLDPHGSGIETGVLARAIYDAVSEECGHLTENGKQLMREGSQRRAGRFQLPRKRLARRIGKAANQHDMIELDPTFAFFIQEWIGSDESQKSVRKPIMKMNLAEFEAAIVMHERKAEETAAQARAMRTLLLNNPIWRQRPKLTLEKLLKIVLAQDQTPCLGDQPSHDQPGAQA